MGRVEVYHQARNMSSPPDEQATTRPLPGARLRRLGVRALLAIRPSPPWRQAKTRPQNHPEPPAHYPAGVPDLAPGRPRRMTRSPGPAVPPPHLRLASRGPLWAKSRRTMHTNSLLFPENLFLFRCIQRGEKKLRMYPPSIREVHCYNSSFGCSCRGD